jgi:hypothetical protein
MTAPAPSAVMDEIVSVLRTKLGATAQEVQTCDSDFGEDGALKDFLTVADPGVLICCLGMPLVPQDFGPPVAAARFLALCLARVPNMTAQDSPGDVAMDLAAMVAGIVDGERWNNKAVGRATKVTPHNENALKTKLKGVSVWSVAWQQNIEIQTATVAPTFNNLRRINFTEKADGSPTTPVTQENLTEDQLHGAIP